MREMEHIYEMGYKLNALNTIFTILKERKETPLVIIYKKYYESYGNSTYLDFENLSRYEQEINLNLNHPINKNIIKPMLSQHFGLALNIRSIWEKEISKIIYDENNKIYIYFTLKEDNYYPFSDILYTKKDQITGNDFFVDMNDYTSDWIDKYNLGIIQLDKYKKTIHPCVSSGEYVTTLDRDNCNVTHIAFLHDYVHKIMDLLYSKEVDKIFFQDERFRRPNNLFDMKLISSIYDQYHNKLWQHIEQSDFLDTLNNPISNMEKIVIRRGESNRMYYLIDKLKQELPEKEKNGWLTQILQSIGISSNTFQSKYRSVLGQERSESDIEFVEQLDSIFEEYHKGQ